MFVWNKSYFQNTKRLSFCKNKKAAMKKRLFINNFQLDLRKMLVHVRIRGKLQALDVKC